MKRGAARRLAGLQWAALAVAALLLARLAVLQVVRHDRYLERAQGQWMRAELLPPARGNLYDRSGRPLALSATTWRVGVATRLVRDLPQAAAQLASALRADPQDVARRLGGAGGGHVVLCREATLSPEALETLRTHPATRDAVTLEQLNDRFYPLDGAGASLIGFYHEHAEGAVATGLERSFASLLSGAPGRAWRLKTARPGDDLGDIVLEEPRHGQHVVLTLDADLQTLCEEELARSIETCGARGGSVLIVEPHTGEILAAAASPLIRDRRRDGGDPAVWNNANFTALYEPGSVFKIFTAAALLRAGALDTSAVFDCSNADFGSFRIHNSEGHSYGPLNMIDAFAQSSNIYFARAAARLDDQQFCAALRDFGFGQRTRVPYGAEPAGLMSRPGGRSWSARSKATMAIGQEIAVTPLQLAMAAAAIANDGLLLAPRLVREVRDADHSPRERVERQVVRRVLSPETARLVRLALARAVGAGTGKLAAVPWTRVGGKTGTAQRAEGGRYVPGEYVCSFLGLVPAGRPRLVILTVLDRPDAAHDYASQSAAPLFANIVEGIRRSSDWLTGVEGPDPALMLASRPVPSLSVPDVLYLSPGAAREVLLGRGLVASGGGRGGLVVAQFPRPDARCAPGDTVRLVVASERAPARVPGQICPDLAGLSNREVGRLTAGLGLPVRALGTGYVVDQQPPAGAPLDTVAAIVVRLEPTWE